jgi:hypothetical protein
MRALRPGLIGFAAFACASAASPAAAQSLDDLLKPGDPVRLVDAFKAICVDPGEDPKAQAAVATAAPWNLEYKGQSGKLGSVYLAFPLQLTLSEVKGLKVCLMTSSIPAESELGPMADLARTRLGTGEPAVNAKNQRLIWSPGAPDGRTISFSLMKSDLDKLGMIAAYRGKLD